MPANIEAPRGPPQSLSPSHVSPGLRALGLGLRAVFILLLAIVIARVSLPQSEKLMSVYETPGDLVRVLLGAVRLVACGVCHP